MDWVSEIDSAMRRIRGQVRETPTMKLALPGLPDDVELKLEHMQHTGSFKARGAFNTLLAARVPQGGVVAASGGNHGAAVAYAAHQLGIPAHIFVPEIAGPAKIDLIRRTGAQLHVVPGVYSDALAAARAHEVQSGAMQVHAYDAPETVAGQGTVFAEWEEQGLDADTVVIAVGGALTWKLYESLSRIRLLPRYRMDGGPHPRCRPGSAGRTRGRSRPGGHA